MGWTSFLFSGSGAFVSCVLFWFPSGSAGIIGCDILRFKKFDEFAIKYQDDTTTNLRTTVDTIRANMDKPGSTGDWKPTEASKAVEYEPSIKRTFRVAPR